MEADEADVDQIDELVDGENLEAATDLSLREINRAVDLLEAYGHAEVHRSMGSHISVRATPLGRLEAERSRAEAARRSVAQDEAEAPTSHDVEDRTASRSVFVVHGRNEGARDQVALVLTKLGFEPVILSEEPNEGRTLIEKFEQHVLSVGYAIALLTADDHGYAAGDDPPVNPNRSRQNVVLELGYFMGKLGRSRVVALYAPGVELPSDLHGLAYIEINDAWPFNVAKELRAAGYPVDLNKL